jgi:hypothetical protein
LSKDKKQHKVKQMVKANQSNSEIEEQNMLNKSKMRQEEM